jgi:polysaccharide export outer membrane protein
MKPIESLLENQKSIMKLTLRDGGVSLLILFILSSCASTKHIAYFQNISDGIRDTSEAIAHPPVNPTIEPDDILLITVDGANPSAAAVFNQGTAGMNPQTYIGATSTTESIYGRAADMKLGYLVNGHGAINFPVLGELNLKGMTLIQAQDTLQQKLLAYLKNPLVDIRFLNYKITVLGEVARPGTYTIPNQQITLLQALGLAGDMTIFGKRMNVMVVREKDGKRQYGRIDMNNSKSLFESPFYYLQQNDVVYVQPRKSRLWNTDQSTLRNVSIAATILSAISILVTRF